MNENQASLGGLDLPALHARLPSMAGRSYWRSLEELAAAPDFEEMVHREFPSQLAVWNDPAGRRNFLRLMAASLAFAGLAGCMRLPEEKIVPYVRAPEEMVPGKPLFFATATIRGGYALGVLAESHEGRPTKIEGNPEHPASLGATDAFAQASILSLYDPDRSQTILRRGVIETWDRFLAEIQAQMASFRKRRGAGLRILTETVTSPTLGWQLETLLADLPEARWHQYEPINLDNVHEGARLAFGKDIETIYQFDKADVVLSLDADFFSVLPGSVRYARDFMDRRRSTAAGREMNRLFVVESTPTITGATADHRLPLRASRIEAFAEAIFQRVRGGATTSPSVEGVSAEWLQAVIQDLTAHRGSSIVIAGPGQPPSVHALAHAINFALENVEKTVVYVEPVEARRENQLASLQELVADMETERVETLVILGGNPVYAAPGGLEFSQKLAKVKQRIHLSEYFDETCFLCDWHVPAAHYLEAWSDARAFDGTATIIQPLIAPLYGGKTVHELLSVLQGQPKGTSYQAVQEYWKTRLGEEDFGRKWRKAVHDGVVEGTRSPSADVGPPTIRAWGLRSDSSAEQVEVEFRPDPAVWDGQYANNGWLQELPRPLTKITWDNVALVSPRTAEQLEIANEDVITIALFDRSITAPVWVMPGQPDNSVSLTFGYGRERSGRVGTGIGYSAYQIRPLQTEWFAAGTIRKTGERHAIATTQNHHSMEGRDIVRVRTHDQEKDNREPSDHSPQVEKLPSLYPEIEYEGNAWGMVIDQTACIGCNACVVACQAENNIPIVGKEQVAVGREMHWLRIDRYFHGELENPETYFQPMLCQHCEKAPCEVVCPVAATVHDSEGTNNMIYNRCVGTRYCSNNCPYKVRRFNYLQFSDETTPSLKLLRNPEVTVRSRGVMEKCSYCIQRISHARIEAKKEQREIRDGEVVTACQQACPTRAIVFGNINDPKSAVHRLKESPLNYSVLGELNTQPRTTYLARVANPHPDLPAPSAAQEPKSPVKAVGKGSHS